MNCLSPHLEVSENELVIHLIGSKIFVNPIFKFKPEKVFVTKLRAEAVSSEKNFADVKFRFIRFEPLFQLNSRKKVEW